MKKQGTVIIMVLVLFFVGLSLGFFIGRNLSNPPVLVSMIDSPATATEPIAQAVSQSPEQSATSGVLVDINTAGVQELTALPGIGNALAMRIIEYRQSNGKFQTVEDLINISGIGEKKLEQLLPYATAGG